MINYLLNQEKLHEECRSWSYYFLLSPLSYTFFEKEIRLTVVIWQLLYFLYYFPLFFLGLYVFRPLLVIDNQKVLYRGMLTSKKVKMSEISFYKTTETKFSFFGKGVKVLSLYNYENRHMLTLGNDVVGWKETDEVIGFLEQVGVKQLKE